jgi:hypothetical protein
MRQLEHLNNINFHKIQECSGGMCTLKHSAECFVYRCGLYIVMLYLQNAKLNIGLDFSSEAENLSPPPPPALDVQCTTLEMCSKLKTWPCRLRIGRCAIFQ